MKKSTSAFTIVELIIVVVVIAILAAISIVAYTGIQNRANDSAVQSDLNNFAKKLQLAAVDTGDFPAGGGINPSDGGTSTGNPGNLPGFVFTPSKSAYDNSGLNLFYCTGVETATSNKIFRIRAMSKSKNVFAYSSNGGAENLGKVSIGWEPATCQGIGYPRTWSYGYYVDAWHPWAS